jgi:hypothetical protein
MGSAAGAGGASSGVRVGGLILRAGTSGVWLSCWSGWISLVPPRRICLWLATNSNANGGGARHSGPPAATEIRLQATVYPAQRWASDDAMAGLAGCRAVWPTPCKR